MPLEDSWELSSPRVGGALPTLALTPHCLCPRSVNLRQQTLEGAGRNIASLRREMERVKQTDAGRLRAEYGRLVEVGLLCLAPSAQLGGKGRPAACPP